MSPSKRLLAAYFVPVLALALTGPASSWADAAETEDQEAGMTHVTVDVSQMRTDRRDASPLARTGDAESLCTGTAIGGIVALGAGAVQLRHRNLSK